MGDVIKFKLRKPKKVKAKKTKVEKALNIIQNDPENESFTESLAILLNETLEENKPNNPEEK